MSIPRRPLGSTGLEVSILGYGAAPLGAMYNSNLDRDEGIRSVHEAFKQGVNFFDTSPYYGSGLSEELLGKGLKDLPRSEVIIGTKLGRYGLNEFDFSSKRVTESIQKSLERLQVESLDVVQCHDIEFVNLDQVIQEAIPALLQAKAAGYVKHIGITGLPMKIYPSVLDRVDAGTLQMVLSYTHHTLFDSTLVEQLPYLKSQGVGVINASSLGMGLLSPHGPPEWHPASDQMKDLCKAARELCLERNISLPRIALYEALQNPEICCTLVGMPTIEEVHQNVETSKLGALTEGEASCLAEVKELLKPVFNQTWPSGLPENN